MSSDISGIEGIPTWVGTATDVPAWGVQVWIGGTGGGGGGGGGGGSVLSSNFNRATPVPSSRLYPSVTNRQWPHF